MDVLIVDPGARGHAFAKKLDESSLVDNVFMAPGNPGTEDLAENTEISHIDIESQIDFVRKNRQIGLVAITADDPLSMGVVNFFEEEFKDRDLKVWGPTKEAARIEWSKVYAKVFMNRNDIPTTLFEIATSIYQPLGNQIQQKFPLFLKMDGLFAGKGVSKANNMHEVREILRYYHKLGRLDKSHPVVIEREAKGIELSLQAFCSGEDYVMVPFAMKDHKTIYDEDNGPMTGGMGVVGPIPSITEHDIEELGEKFVAPVLKELSNQGRPFNGMLFPGLRGWQCLEYNARPGDPEAQVWTSLLESDLAEIMLASCTGELDTVRNIKWKKATAACIVLAAKGYPDYPEKGSLITGLDADFSDNTLIYHAGTKKIDNDVFVDGGRVLNIVHVGNEGLDEVINRAYLAAEKLDFEGKQIRTDVGKEVQSKNFTKQINLARKQNWKA
jgi:phosphoribosylamine--glycine ligase